MSRYIEVPIDIRDFSDDEVIARAAEIRRNGGAGPSPLDDASETPRETLERLMSEAAAAIAAGDRIEALRALDALAGDDRGLRDAVDLGWRRRRP